MNVNLTNDSIQNLPEFNNLIGDIKPLLKSTDFLIESHADLNKKDWGWGDLILYGIAWINFGLNVQKTAADFNQFVEAVKNPKPQPTPIDVRFLLAMQNPAFAYLNNQTFNITRQ